jgi:hypothetical protein
VNLVSSLSRLLAVVNDQEECAHLIQISHECRMNSLSQSHTRFLNDLIFTYQSHCLLLLIHSYSLFLLFLLVSTGNNFNIINHL